MKTVIYARVINSVSDEPIENGMVEIEDDHIVYVGEKRECTDSDAQIFDLEGKTVMPGFIDAHALFDEARAFIRLVTHHMICF